MSQYWQYKIMQSNTDELINSFSVYNLSFDVLHKCSMVRGIYWYNNEMINSEAVFYNVSCIKSALTHLRTLTQIQVFDSVICSF